MADRSDQPHVSIVSTYYAPETTGNAPYVTGLATGLADRGFRVTVLAGAPHYPEWRVRDKTEWASEEHADNLSIRRVTSYVPARPSFPRRMVYELLFGLRFSALVPRDADVVLLVNPSLFAAAIVRARLSLGAKPRPRTMLWTQDLYSAGLAETPGRLSGILGSLMAKVEGALARSCDAMVVIHPRFARYAQERLGVDSKKLSVIRNWTHIAFGKRTSDPDFRSSHGWSSEETIVLHAGNQGAKQGLENVVEAARIAEKSRAPLKFVLLGDGNQRHRLEELAGDCPNIEFLDPLPGDEFERALAAADVLLVNERPSLNEAAVPSKLTTYFATGKPILAATDSASTTSEEMRASGAGVVLPPANPEALVDASLKLVRDWSLEHSKAGPSFVAANLTADAAIHRFCSILQQLLPGRRSEALVQTQS